MKKTITHLAVGALLCTAGTAQAQWLVGGNALGANGNFGTTTNVGVNFITNNLSRMTLTNGGLLGIGTTAPTFLLDVQSAGNASASFKSTGGTANLIIDRGNAAATSSVSYRTGGSPTWQTGTLGTNNFAIRNIALGAASISINAADNFVGIGTNAPTARLHVLGNVNASGGVTTVDTVLNVNGNLNVSGAIRIGTIETLTDEGGFTMGCNSDFVSVTDGLNNLGNSGARWRNLMLRDQATIGTASSRNIATDSVSIRALNNGVASNLAVTASNFTLDNAGGTQFINSGSGNNMTISGVGGGSVGLKLNRVGTGSFDFNLVNNFGILEYRGSTDEFATVNNLFMSMSLSSGNIGMGVAASGTYKLSVCGTVRATELRLETGWCDYVFADDYRLKS
ncbi:MAG TPA: hypothetical protein PLO59_02030, partial [Bacteroidia bacterium]|nr:hypothetical protein [Bacteroidia bacterium]